MRVFVLSVYYSEVYIEPDRRVQIERAVAAKRCGVAFKSAANQNTHNNLGTFSNAEYMHTARPTTATAPPHTTERALVLTPPNGVRSYVKQKQYLNSSFNSPLPVPRPPSAGASAAPGVDLKHSGASAPSLIPALDLCASSAEQKERAQTYRPDPHTGGPRVHLGLTSVRRRYYGPSSV